MKVEFILLHTTCYYNLIKTYYRAFACCQVRLVMNVRLVMSEAYFGLTPGLGANMSTLLSKTVDKAWITESEAMSVQIWVYCSKLEGLHRAVG
jgi:hypothetical protein